MKDLSSLVKGVSDAMFTGEFGLIEGSSDTDPDGGTTFENMDGDAGYPHSNSPSNIGHDHYKSKGVKNG